MSKYTPPDFEKLDNKVELQITSTGEFRTGLIGMLFKVEIQEDPFSILFIKYMDDLIGDVVALIPEYSNGIWNSINGKFSNNEDWNFLNPIGELSALKQFLLTGEYKLEAMESSFPNGRPKDFLFTRVSDKEQVLVEVVNIHTRYPPISKGIEDFILEKLTAKIHREIDGVTDKTFLNKLILFPVVWYLSVEDLKDNHNFLKLFHETNGEKYGLKHQSFGFHTYIKVDNKIIFGEASSLMDASEN